jgi:hypothetical protein
MLTHANIASNVIQAYSWIAGPAGRRGIHHHGLAAVSHLRADRELLDLHDDWCPQPADRQSA